MNTKTKIMLLVSIAAAAITVYATSEATVKCPIDDSQMIWTGKSTIELGKMLYEYKCPLGHATWVVQKN